MKKLGGVYSSHRVHVRGSKPDFNSAFASYHWHRDHGLLEFDAGKTPLQELRIKQQEQKIKRDLGRLHNLEQYQRVVLAKTVVSTTTMFWSGTQAFLIEEYANGLHRVSYASTDREYLKQLFTRGKIIWRGE